MIYLEVKMQQEMCAYRLQRMNAPSKVQKRYLEVIQHQERLNDIKKGTRDVFRGLKTLSKTKPINLEVKLDKAKFD